MYRLFKNQSLRKINLLGLVFVVILLFVFIASFFVGSYIQYKKDIENLEQEYLASQKEFIKKESLRALKFIDYKFRTNTTKSPQALQKEIIDAIEHMRNEGDGTGYIFVYTFDGINIADPILKQNSGKNLLDFTDLNGKKVIYELIKVSKTAGGGYVDYLWNKPTTNKPSPKISYAIAYKPLGWMIGSGVYLDDIQEMIALKKQTYLEQLFHYFYVTFVLIFTLFGIGIGVYRYFINTIEKDIEVIHQASLDLKQIDTQSLNFKEFKEVAEHINAMNENLKDLNKNLEIKVKNRTSELELAKEYALDLVAKQDKFIKDAIHEINTPLGIIIANIDLFILKYGKNRYLSKIEAGSKIIHNIYNDLEYMVKKDRIEYPKKELSLSELVFERVDFFGEVALGNELAFDLFIQKEMIIFMNDIHLQRVIDNTLSNAIKYATQGTKIIVRLYEDTQRKTLEVTNEGKLIRDPKKLFERFYRENDSRGGFGIGLSIIKEICDKNNIEVSVESREGLITFRYNFV